jgi:hypothetical protein
MSDPELKVTDKRMFTREGELREEWRSRPQGEPAPRQERQPPATLLDLIALLARSVAASLGGEEPSPELARFHIDLLEVLRRKTDGNLDAAERAALDDVLYRLRMLYVETTAH